MKFVSWNVNGLRAVMGKNFLEIFKDFNADAFCIQETKMQEGQADINIPGYHMYMNSAIKKGYSGTLIYTKQEPINVIYGIDGDLYNDEGRIITLEFEGYYLVTAYVPNSQEELKRLDYRMEFEDNFSAYLNRLKAKKPVIMCGDLNVAHERIDIKNPDSNVRNAGFTIEERTKLTRLLDLGFTDSFRYLHKDLVKYSWWSYRFRSREKNIGWRIDYFIVSNDIKDKILEADICTDVLGSDHAPVYIDIDIK